MLGVGDGGFCWLPGGSDAAVAAIGDSDGFRADPVVPAWKMKIRQSTDSVSEDENHFKHLGYILKQIAKKFFPSSREFYLNQNQFQKATISTD